MSKFGDILTKRGFKLYVGEAFGTFYQKCIEENHTRRYFIEVYEYDFVRFKPQYEGPDYRYDIRMSFYEKSGDYLEMRTGIHDIDYRDELVDMIEEKCEKWFVNNNGVDYEDLVAEGGFY